MGIFRRRGYVMTLGRVHDTVTVREGEDRLTLTVNDDPVRIVAGLNRAQEKLKGLTDTSPDDDVKAAALYFAQVIFGADQAGQLLAFYHEDPASVINVCGRYFSERLAGIITTAQKRMKNAETV